MIVAMSLLALLFRKQPDLKAARLKYNSKTFIFTTKEVSVGSDKRNDIVIDGRGVRPYHCVLRCDKGGWCILKINPACPVSVNGKDFRKDCLLKFGDYITVGEAKMVFEYGEEAFGGKRQRRPKSNTEVKNSGKKKK